ncbi:MAG: S41 family peptidase [Bacteroidales bacterium]|nr:S41 family peptidase [Bacteroidales bacterium]
MIRRKIVRTLVICIAAFAMVFSTLSFTNDKRNFEVIKNLDIFYSLFKELNNYYVDEINPEKLIRTAIDEMLKSLDPYTNYIPEEDMDDFKFMTTGEYGGIGAIISRSDTCYIMVREIYKGMPADKIGLRPGDYFVEINGKSVKDFKVDQVSNQLRGKPGEEVKLTIWRPGQPKFFGTVAKREKIQINPVSYYGMVDATTGYISLSNFTQDCSSEVKKAFLELKQKRGAKKMILDLRGNPGGLLDEAIRTVNMFVPRGSEVLSTKGKIKSYDKVYRATREPVDTEMPLVVLISRGSASASEIVAGALQDLDRAVIIGQRSFGKGLVQSTRELDYKSALKMTTAKYYIPSGRCIQALDYSHRDKDGAVGYVPDSLIHEFKTKVGRTVFDGGGVSPDIKIDLDKYSNITASLVSNDVIFRYAVDYRIRHASIADADNFKITDADYDDFCNFVANQKSFTYKNQSSEALKKLVTAAKADKYYDDNKADFDRLEKSLEPKLEKDLATSKEDIVEFIEDEILTSYYYRGGSSAHALKSDKNVECAIATLNDMDKYRGLLNGSVPSHAGDKRISNEKNTDSK